MPKVGNKEFSYDKEGMKKAEEYAKNTNQEMEMYYGGGMVDARNRSQMYMEDGGMISEKEYDMLEEHKEHLSEKHMNEMEQDMLKGSSFKKAHNKAMKKVGK